jgi:hypothetical protein
MDYVNLAQPYVFASAAQRSKAAVMDSFATLGKTGELARKDGGTGSERLGVVIQC